jgi:hypothetical protein
MLANHEIHLTVAYLVAFINDRRVVFDSSPVRNDATPIRLAIMFPALFLAAQLLP